MVAETKMEKKTKQCRESCTNIYIYRERERERERGGRESCTYRGEEKEKERDGFETKQSEKENSLGPAMTGNFLSLKLKGIEATELETEKLIRFVGWVLFARSPAHRPSLTADE